MHFTVRITLQSWSSKQSSLLIAAPIHVNMVLAAYCEIAGGWDPYDPYVLSLVAV
jgi:hypothetical protein